MGITVTLDNELVNSARHYSTVQSRSVPNQIKHWAEIGHMVEDNPDLSYNDIRNILLGLEDVKAGKVEKYRRGIL